MAEHHSIGRLFVLEGYRDEARAVMASNLTTETKYYLIMNIAESVRTFGIQLKYHGPDATHEEGARATVDEIEALWEPSD